MSEHSLRVTVIGGARAVYDPSNRLLLHLLRNEIVESIMAAAET